jgi:hypothetical protein
VDARSAGGTLPTLPYQRLTAPPGDVDFLGVSVAVQGDVALIGARDPTWEGRVFVARRVGGTWSFTGEHLDAGPFRFANARFGASVALSGDWAIVGAPGNEWGTRAGEAYFFHQSDGRFEERGRVQAPSPRNEDWFGLRVAIEGDVAVVGAPERYHDLTDGVPGAVYVFRRGGSAFVPGESLRAPEPAAGPDAFGLELALRGSRLVVGAPLRRDRGSEAGAVFIAEDLGGYRIVRSLVSGLPSPETHRFGEGSLGLGDDVLLVPSSGAYVQSFERMPDGIWRNDVLPQPGEGAPSLGFGWHTAAHEDRAIVCVRESGGSVGRGLMYRRVETVSGVSAVKAWRYEAELRPDLETPVFFGWAVAFDGATAVVSALFEENYRGAVYFFDVPP